MTAKLTQEAWIEQATKVHNGKYTYEFVRYVSGNKKVEITCPLHGNFWQQAASHKDGRGCKDCGMIATIKGQSLGVDAFVARATEIHNGEYDYSEVVYKNSDTHITVICKEHGRFSCLPGDHLNGHKCGKCAASARGVARTSNVLEFAEKAQKVHPDKYLYNLVEYKSSRDKVSITCKDHGNFMQSPTNHLNGAGCPHCGKTGYNSLKPGHLYVLVSGNVTKVGITNRSPQIRIREIKNTGSPNFVVAHSAYFEEGKRALSLETTILQMLSAKYSKVAETFQGSSECFLDVDVEELLNYIAPLTTPEAVNSPQLN